MSYSSHEKVLKQLKAKPAKLKRYAKFNCPKERKFGFTAKRCRRCGRTRAHIGKYGLDLCRQCFKEIATRLGFKKYS